MFKLILLALLSLILVEGQDTQRESLVLFFQQMNGQNWREKGNWMTNSSVCDWYGVFCREGGVEVERIELKNNNLSGVLPPLGGLTYLREMSLFSNKITFSLSSLTKILSINTKFVHNFNRFIFKKLRKNADSLFFHNKNKKRCGQFVFSSKLGNSTYWKQRNKITPFEH